MLIRPLLGFLFLIGVTFPLVGGERLGLVINEDNSHFFTSRTAEEMSLEGLHALVDQYADTEVSHLFFSTNSMKTSFASYAWEAIWELGDQAPPDTAKADGGWPMRGSCTSRDSIPTPYGSRVAGRWAFLRGFRCE